MPNRNITLSIISHGQAEELNRLLKDLDRLDSSNRFQVIATFNIPEKRTDLKWNFTFPLKFIKNNTPKGFGANHNAAFSLLPVKEESFFIIINPDVSIREDIFSYLVKKLKSDKKTGVAAPLVKSLNGTMEDSTRKIPTPKRIFLKLFGNQGKWEGSAIAKEPFEPDWIAGMFMAFRSDVFKQIGGFNENYFLYYEDVELCCRIWLNNMKVSVEPSICIIHDAQRKSRKNIKYLRWHLRSMGRFFGSSVYRQIRKHRKV